MSLDVVEKKRGTRIVTRSFRRRATIRASLSGVQLVIEGDEPVDLRNDLSLLIKPPLSCIVHRLADAPVMSKTQMARMFGNVGVDFALGLIPWVGAVPDFFFRSNSRNLKIIRKHLDKHHPSTAAIEG